MYIKRINIKNVRSINFLEMLFENTSFEGWHVIVGDNGSGKTTLIRSIALSLLDAEVKHSVLYEHNKWRRSGSEYSGIRVEFEEIMDNKSTNYLSEIQFESTVASLFSSQENKNKYFSASYGPYRRFTGGRKEHDKTFESSSQLAAHLSCFGEDVALTEIIPWLQKLQFKKLELTSGLSGERKTLVDYVKSFINDNSLLPHNTKLNSITSDKVTFTDGNGNEISITELSDGYRSVLSLTLELIRQMVNTFDETEIFKLNKDGLITVDISGVVLIDEVDAHLHPTWQTKIGDWFTKYFPKIQFIVTTHSPLICRASETGTIWKLSAPGEEDSFRKIVGEERDRLILGNVLEAYGTNVFGEKTSRSQKGSELLDRLAKLNKKFIMGKISDLEKEELIELKHKMPTAK